MTNLPATSSAPGADNSNFDADPPTDSSTTSAATHTASVAADQAAHVRESATQAAGEVADVTKEEVGRVAAETKRQAKDLLGDARTQLTEQAGEQQARVAEGLRAISEELTQMATASHTDGVATDLVQQAASRAGNIATWLDDRDPGSLLDEVRSYARRKPGTFIALAAAAGILAGRLTRSVAADSADDSATEAKKASMAPRTSFSPARDLTDDQVMPLHSRGSSPVAANSMVGATGIVGLTGTTGYPSVADRPDVRGADPDLAVPER